MTKTAKTAIIAGSGFEQAFLKTEQALIETPYGAASLQFGRFADCNVAFLLRHGPKHSIPPHKINYRANMWALHTVGVEKIVALNAVGAINRDFKPLDIVVPHDFLDFTKTRLGTFCEDAPVMHVDMSEPYCPAIRRVLWEKLQVTGLRCWERAVYVCTEGPRYETPAEVEMFRRLGGDVVGMTEVPEVVLARELRMCYAAVCYVSNLAAGLQPRLSHVEVMERSKHILEPLEQALIETVKVLPLTRAGCSCRSSLEDGRIS